MTLSRISLFFVVSLPLGGCASYGIGVYSMSADNVSALRDMVGQEKKKIGVSEFTSFEPGKTYITCRAAGPVIVPDGQSFEGYIRDALVSELKFAGIYSDESDLKIKGHLKHIDFSSTSGVWEIALETTLQETAPFTVRVDHEFSGGFVGDAACRNVAAAFVPAVQKVIGGIIENPRFRETVMSK